MNETNRQVVLRSRPQGVADENVELVETDVPALGDQLSRRWKRGPAPGGIDAAVRTWLDDQPGYLPPVQLGEVVRAATVGEVVATNCEAYQVGDVVTTLGGFSDYSIARDACPVRPTRLMQPAGLPTIVFCAAVSASRSSDLGDWPRNGRSKTSASLKCGRPCWSAQRPAPPFRRPPGQLACAPCVYTGHGLTIVRERLPST